MLIAHGDQSSWSMKLSDHLHLDEGFGFSSIWLTLLCKFFRRLKTIFAVDTLFLTGFPNRVLTFRVDEGACKLFEVLLLDT